MSTSGGMDSRRFEQACEWFLRLREQPQSEELTAQWLAWCRADPLNRLAFARAQEIWCVTAKLTDEDLGIPGTCLESQTAESGSGPGVRATSGEGRWLRMSRLAGAGALAAGLAAIGVALSWLDSRPVRETLTTSIATQSGQNLRAVLEDGSVVVLGGESRVSVTLGRELRKLVLDRGEAFFEVAHDRARPFTVTARNLRVTAVGTAFNVRTSSERVVVAVAEGEVAIDPPAARSGGGPLHARAGQEVSMIESDASLHVAAVSAASVGSWRNGRLEFVRAPLSEVVASVERYSDRPIHLDDPGLRRLQFTGTVFADNTGEWLQALTAVFAVDLQQAEGYIAIVPRAADDERQQ